MTVPIPKHGQLCLQAPAKKEFAVQLALVIQSANNEVVKAFQGNVDFVLDFPTPERKGQAKKLKSSLQPGWNGPMAVAFCCNDWFF
jgi:hypothetical protein